MLLLGACGTRSNALDAPASTTTTTQPAASTTTAVGETPPLALGQPGKTRDGNTIRVLSWVQPVASSGPLEPDLNQVYAAAEIEICAGRRGAPRVSPEVFAVQLEDGSSRGRTYFGPQQPELGDAKLVADQCVQGWVNFEVPSGHRPSYVVFKGSSHLRWLAGGRTR
ncbi:MAG TPA: hypothetical protein VFJ85_07620 [Acidimicrobiales bacterium]|nr:hypothetical protein [Acidimicrobiales bacterium]